MESKQFAADIQRTKPGVPSVMELQHDICHLMMVLPQAFAPLLSTNKKALVGLARLLWLAVVQNEDVGSVVVPLLSSLTAVLRVDNENHSHPAPSILSSSSASSASSSSPASASSASSSLSSSASPVSCAEYMRCVVFGAFALIDGTKKKDANQLGMLAEGAKNEKELDPSRTQPLRTFLLQSVTSFQMNLKTTVSEFLWQLCQEDSHTYIRLAGFGNAVGLLADKGLPGFSHLKDNAIDMDALLKSGNKL